MSSLAVYLDFLPATCRDLLQIGLGLATAAPRCCWPLAYSAARGWRHRPGRCRPGLPGDARGHGFGTLVAAAVGGRLPTRWALALPAAQQVPPAGHRKA